MKFVYGDIFKSSALCLVNPVNCVGVAGAGLAKEFKRRFPANFAAYRRNCAEGRLRPGVLFTVKTPTRRIVNFPTKRHWRDPASLDDIESGLDALAGLIANNELPSVAIPALGCGLGGPRWAHVRRLLVRHLGGHPAVTVYEPEDQC